MKLPINLPGSPARTSQVTIEKGVMKELPAAIGACLGKREPYWIWDETVWGLWGQRVLDLGWPRWKEGRLILFRASEANKRLSALEDLARQLARSGADRQSALVAVGGGVTGDVVGFLASIYMRGIPHIQVPTTLLAQVDSSIGGKTGVDLPEGKNLLGSFHQPDAIWMDPQFLETLPPHQLRQGMAEVIKTALIGDPSLWELLEARTEALKRRESDPLARVITACCRLKADVVESDEREAGRRRVLNLGHTVGHALERLSDYAIPHGDAVSMGLAAAARFAVYLGRLARESAERIERLCEAWELPVRLPARFSPEEILAAIQTDKKRMRGTLHFILPVGIGEVADCDDLNLQELAQVLAALRHDD